MEFGLVFAGPDDVDLLVKHRLGLLREVHPELETKIEESGVWTREWIRKRLSDGELIGLLAKAKDGKVAGSGCKWLRDEQPRPTNPSMIAPYLKMSMYTAPGFRRKGVARLIVQNALKWCKERGTRGLAFTPPKRGSRFMRAWSSLPRLRRGPSSEQPGQFIFQGTGQTMVVWCR